MLLIVIVLILALLGVILTGLSKKLIGKQTQRVKIEDLKIGDHIFVQRELKMFKIGYLHHGIITQLEPMMKIANHKGPYIEESNLETFLKASKVCRTSTPQDIERVIYGVEPDKNDRIGTKINLPVRPVKKVLRAVKRELRHKRKYSLWDYNCETMCIKCCTGVPLTLQPMGVAKKLLEKISATSQKIKQRGYIRPFDMFRKL